jgi:tetratricopeptide (TPR) repeat protein
MYERWTKAFPYFALVLFATMIYGTMQRNTVWHTEETLWADVVIKSPHNGRGLMNYGLCLMGRGDYEGALRMFGLAKYWTPYYSILFVNEGIALGAVGRDAEAEADFRTAQRLAPRDAQSYWYFARFLRSKGRILEADTQLDEAKRINQTWVNSL